MKAKFIKSFIKKNIRFFISLILCSAICFSLLVIFSHVKDSLKTGSNQFLHDYDYYNGIVQVTPYIEESELEQIRNIDGVRNVISFFSKDYQISDNIFNTLRITATDMSIFDYYCLDKQEEGDLYLQGSYAQANNIKVGDTITIDDNGNKIDLVVKEIINTPEFIGLTRTEISGLELTTYGVGLVDINTFERLFPDTYHNHVVYYFEDNVDEEKLDKEIEDIIGYKAVYYEKEDNLVAKKTIETDISIVEPIATSLPIVFYSIGLIISILFIRQFMDSKVRDIGIMKSIGLDNKYILSLFIDYSVIVTILSSILGTIISITQIRLYIDLYTKGTFLPQFSINNNYLIIFIAFIITLIFNVLAVLLNMKNITNIDVVDIINNADKSKFKKNNLFRNKIVSLKPFISSILINPFRFIFTFLNLTFIVVLVTGAVSIGVSKDNSIKFVTDKMTNYEYIVHYKNPIENNNQNSFYDKVIPVTYKDKTKLVEINVLNNLEYITLYDEDENIIKLKDGIIIPKETQEELNVNVGDYLTINDQQIKITDIAKETSMFKSYMSYNTFNKYFDLNYSNSLFINDLNEIDTKDSNIKYITSNETFKKDINQKFNYIDRYIKITIGFAVVISIIVIFNISVVFYNERYHCFKNLRTIGFSKTRIIFSSLIEIILQSLLALIIGMPVGYYFSTIVVQQMNNNFLRFYTNIKDMPFIPLILFIIITSVIGRIIASKNKIVLVEE